MSQCLGGKRASSKQEFRTFETQQGSLQNQTTLPIFKAEGSRPLCETTRERRWIKDGKPNACWGYLKTTVLCKFSFRIYSCEASKLIFMMILAFKADAICYRRIKQRKQIKKSLVSVQYLSVHVFSSISFFAEEESNWFVFLQKHQTICFLG